MIKNIFITLLFLLTFMAQAQAQSVAQDFDFEKNQPAKIDCKLNKNSVQFKDLKPLYRLYDKNISEVKIEKCEKITVQKQVFYTVLYSTYVKELGSSQKVLIYEVALASHKSKIPQTVRSEIVDQVDLSGDPVDLGFQSSIESSWGKNKKDNSIMLKLNIMTKNEKPFPYYLKFNTKSIWFENIF